MSIRHVLNALLIFTGNCFAADSSLPYVDEKIDPAKSYWTDHVHYSFPHQFARVADGQGRQWEIAYGDLFRGDAASKDKAPTLILLHGRAMNSGYWGQLMEAPLTAGWRVVTIDWSNTGKSLPRNMKSPVNRTLADSRQIIFNLVVNHLGIKKASYLGHSLGGHVAAGYALQFPENVSSLVLYGIGSLESLPPFAVKGVRLDDPELAKSPEAFLKLWNAAQDIFSMGRTQEEVEKSFYAVTRPGTMPYLQRGDKLGEFIVASRAGVLHGNAAERERFLQSYLWESVASIVELRLGDVDSIPNNIHKLKMPTLVTFGVKDSAIPISGTGNTSLVSDVVHPFYRSIKWRKAPVEIKLYANAGHFIHTDLPEQFSRDVLTFLQTGKAVAPVYAGDQERYLPAARTPLATLPQDVQGFKTRFEQAYVKQDMTAIRALYTPDFKSDGKTLEHQLSFIESFITMISNQELLIFGIETKEDRLVIDVEARNNFGKFPYMFILKKTDGEWRLHGDQR